MGFWDGSGISRTIRKQSAPRSRQITTPTPHRSSFLQTNGLPDAKPTVSRHQTVFRPSDNHTHDHGFEQSILLLLFFFAPSVV